MPKESCIEHPRGSNFVIIREHYVRMFNGDHALAALVSCFEYYTNGQLALMEARNQSGDPWFEASVDSITSQIVGLYGRTKIYKSIETLRECSIILSEKTALGHVNKYLFNVSLVQDLIRSGGVLEIPVTASMTASMTMPATNPVTISGHGETVSVTAPVTTFVTTFGHGDDVYIGKEFRTQNSEESNTTTSDSLRSSGLTYQQAVSTVEQHFGRKLTSKEKQTLLRTVEYYGADQEECIALAAAVGITKNGNGKMRRSASEEYEGGSTHRFRQSSRPSASNARETVFVERPQISDEWRNDPEYMRYLNALGSTGKRIDPKYASPAYESLWQRLNEQEKALSIEDAAYIANERRNKPEIIPNPLDHLSAKPWQALRPNKAAGTRQGETKEERNARIYAEYLKEKDRGKIVSNGTR